MTQRATLRGTARRQEANSSTKVDAPPPATQPPAKGDASRLETQITSTGDANPCPLPEVHHISASLQQIKITDSGGHRQDFHDVGVSTCHLMEHVKESKIGVSGSQIQLRANFFRLLLRLQWALYQYHKDFKPAMKSRRLQSVLLQHDKTLGKAHTYDGTVLFLPYRLHNSETVLCSETRLGERVQITVTLTNKLPPSSAVCLQFYNIVFRRILKMLTLQQVGCHYYIPGDPLDIPQHRLIIWPDFVTTIMQYESSIMLCTDVSHKVLRSETILDFMVTLKQQCGDQRFPDACTKELVGLIVLTKYNNKTYRIDDIAWDHNPNNTFKRGDTDISFKDYYKMQYGLDITDGNQVLLVSHVKRMVSARAPPPGPALLVPELCYLTGMTNKMRNDFNIKKDLSSHTTLTPEQREDRINKFITNISKNAEAQKEPSTWGLSFENKLLSVTGRVLSAERIIQGNRTYEYNRYIADWSKEMRDIPLISSMPLESWLMFYTHRNSDIAHCLLQTLNKVTGRMGISMQRAVMIEYEDRLESLLRALQQNVGRETQMVVVILSSKRKDKYDCVKKYLCVDCPTPSQCVVSRTLSRPQALMSVATKIALQMNCKMGGELWSIDIPLPGLMVVGIDCYHDTVAGKRSIAALVSSLNKGMSRWFSKCVLQDQGQEIIDALKVSLQAALRAYLRFNNCLPTRIIVYRDGVRDGMLQSVVNYEVPQIIQSIKTVAKDYVPRLSVVVVKKHITYRFFARIDGKLANPPPGTIIDTEVTQPEWYGFFIVSQTVHGGTISPTHYNVVFDNSGLKPDHMQRLTYKLCLMYYNWQGTIRVPAPCQYARNLAILVGESIHKEPNTNLDDVLYYL